MVKAKELRDKIKSFQGLDKTLKVDMTKRLDRLWDDSHHVKIESLFKVNRSCESSMNQLAQVVSVN